MLLPFSDKHCTEGKRLLQVQYASGARNSPLTLERYAPDRCRGFVFSRFCTYSRITSIGYLEDLFFIIIRNQNLWTFLFVSSHVKSIQVSVPSGQLAKVTDLCVSCVMTIRSIRHITYHFSSFPDCHGQGFEHFLRIFPADTRIGDGDAVFQARLALWRDLLIT